MSVIPTEFGAAVSRESVDDLARYFDLLWPIMRSITGDGVRQSHEILSELMPLDRIEIPSNSEVFDWTVPLEWRLRDAYVVAPDGRRLLDAAANTLHVVNYSTPFRGVLSRAELDGHLHSRADLPDAIPYVTAYYQRDWGFCLSHNDRLALPDGDYEVVIDSEHFEGSMTLSEAVLPGQETREVLFSTYSCHPSMANDNLSGMLAAAFLYRRLAALPERRLTYRFVILPETIGSIAYLHRRGEHLQSQLEAGYVLSCIGDNGPFTYKRSRRGETVADRAAVHVLGGPDRSALRVHEFSPDGSDERQYCSPGFDLPVGVVARSIYSGFPEYHSSRDDRDFISFDHLLGSIDALFAICMVHDRNVTYRNLNPHCEPQLGKRGLFNQKGGLPDVAEQISAHLWLLNLADGGNDLLSIAERSGIDISILDASARALSDGGLLERADA